jgi:hypothetical protein
MNGVLKFLRRYGWLVGVVAITLAWSLLLIGDAVPTLRGPAGRRWPYEPAMSSARATTVGFVFLVYLVGAIWLMRRAARQDADSNYLWVRAAIVWAVLGTASIQCAVIYLRHSDVLRELFDRTVSLHSGGYFSAVVSVESINEYLRRFPTLMPDFPIHPKRHPPGIPLAFWLARQAFSLIPSLSRPAAAVLRRFQCDNLWLQSLSDPQVASAWVSIVLPGLAGLVVLPLYRLGRHFMEKRLALTAVLVYPLIPSVSLFATMWDQLIPLFTTLALLALVKGLEQRRLVLVAGAGVAMSVGTFFSLGMVMGLAVLGLYALFCHISQRPVDAQRVVLDGVVFAAGLASVWLVYWLFWEVTVLDIWQVAMSFHFDMKDTYLPGLFHLYDFLVFLGIPLVFLLVRGVWQAFRSSGKGTTHLLALAFGLGLLVIDLSGSSKGEVARVWMFLIPWAVVVGVQALGQLNPRDGGLEHPWLASAVIVLVGVQTFAAATNLQVIHTRHDEPSPPVSIASTLPSQAQPLRVQFDDGIELVGYRVESDVNADPSVAVTLYWRARAFVKWPWTVFRHVMADGELVGQRDGPPVGGKWPTTCWEPGQVVMDAERIPLDAHDLEGATLRIGLYDPQSGRRLPVTGADSAAQDDAVEIPLSP